ncbi:Dynein light chain like [Quillaja saponaria]|uniref:Dynein light chain like n=1 Tax=Quillaja saponaria TaxID=32244 RepID=A0AAD7VKD0_QUISA|nr:Dynein light chain like [Quillaja saponaria]
MATQEKQKRGFKFIYKAGNGSQRKKEFEPDVMVDKKPILLSWISRKSKTCPDNKTSGRRSRLEADVGGGGGMVEARKSVSHIDTHLIEARKSMFHIEPNMVEARKSVSHINTNLVEARKSVSQMETNSASVIAFLQVKVMVSDMPSFMQVHAFRCARKTFDSLEKFSPKHMAFNMKKAQQDNI